LSQDEDDEKTKDNGVLVQVTLRSLDVLFFVLENLNCWSSQIVETSQTVSSRVDEVEAVWYERLENIQLQYLAQDATKAIDIL
jgi:hypothetical protein